LVEIAGSSTYSTAVTGDSIPFVCYCATPAKQGCVELLNIQDLRCPSLDRQGRKALVRK
jgi:hypothetical protein